MRSLLWVIWLIAACGPLPAQRSRLLTPGAQALVADLQVRMKTQKVRDLAALFTPHCRRSCRGFVPLPSSVNKRTITGHWSPRLRDGLLMEDLARVLLSYEQINTVTLTPVRHRKFPGKVQLRAHLLIEGRPRHTGSSSGQGPQWLRDHGLVDLGLSRTPAGWRIDHFAAARMRRELPGPEPQGAPPMERQTPAPGSEATAPSADAAAPATEHQPARAASPTPAPSSPIPEQFLSLTVRDPAGPVPLSTLAGSRGTLVLIRAARCPKCAVIVPQLAALERSNPGVKALMLVLGDGHEPAPAPGVRRGPLPWLPATSESAAALQGLCSLLPLLVILDSAGRSVRIVDAQLPGEQLQGLIP